MSPKFLSHFWTYNRSEINAVHRVDFHKIGDVISVRIQIVAERFAEYSAATVGHVDGAFAGVAFVVDVHENHVFGGVQNRVKLLRADRRKLDGAEVVAVVARDVHDASDVVVALRHVADRNEQELFLNSETPNVLSQSLARFSVVLGAVESH